MKERRSDWPTGWEPVTIGDVVVSKVQQGAPHTAFTYIDIGSVDNKTKQIESAKGFAADSKIPSRAQQHVRASDILVSMTRPNLNAVAKVPTELDGAICSTGFEVLRTIEVEPDWLFLVVKSRPFIEEMASLVQGALYPAVRPADVRAYKFALPPLAEQQRIVAKIEALQERSRRAREALTEVGPLLEQFRQSVLAAAFRGNLTADWRTARPDVEPASELLRRIRTERRRRWEQAELAKYEAKGTKPPKGWQDKYEEPESVDDSTLPKIPSSWEWVRVKDVGEVQLGRQRAPQYHSGPNMRPYLRVMNVFEDRIDTEDVMEMEFSPEEFERYRLEPGDILLNEGQSRELVGRSAIYRGEIPGACFTNTLVRFRPDAPIASDYPQIVFLGYLKTGRFQRLAALTVNIAHLGAGRFADMGFPLPPLEEQAEIVRRARGALDQITRLEEKLRATFADLDHLDQAILAKAFRGELVPQDPSDEPASALLARIREQRVQQTEAAKHKQKAATTQRGTQRSEEASKPTPQQLTLPEVLLTKD